MLDWIIIGGGIHGTHLSNSLNRSFKALSEPDKLMAFAQAQIDTKRLVGATTICIYCDLRISGDTAKILYFIPTFIAQSDYARAYKQLKTLRALSFIT